MIQHYAYAPVPKRITRELSTYIRVPETNFYNMIRRPSILCYWTPYSLNATPLSDCTCSNKKSPFFTWCYRFYCFFTSCHSDSGEFDVLSILLILKAKLNFPIRIGGESARVDRVHWVAAASSVVAARDGLGTGFMNLRDHLGTVGKRYRRAFSQVQTCHLPYLLLLWFAHFG